MTGAREGESSPLPPGAAEGLLGTVGGVLKPTLRKAAQSGGMERVDALLGSIKQSAGSPQQLESTLGRERMEQMMGKAPQTSGLSPDLITSMLPVIIPAVVALLQSSARRGAPSAQTGVAAGNPLAAPAANPLLQSYLDSDGDGHVDMADLVAMGLKFLR